MRERFHLGRNVTLKKVVCWEKRLEIEDVVRELSGAAPGHPDYLACYSKGLQQVIRDMDRDELRKMERSKEEWRATLYPVDVQRRWVFHGRPRGHPG